MEVLCCLLRRRHVAATPEEQIRQRLLEYMLAGGAYPRGLLAVEVALKKLSGKGVLPPRRRLDIVCYTPTSDGTLSPLLLVECKAAAVTTATLRQATGYNYYLHAPFLTLVGSSQVYTGYHDSHVGGYTFVSGLPDYATLLQNKRDCDKKSM